MKRLLILLLLFLFLGGATFWYLNSDSEMESKMTVLQSERDFAVPAEEVHKIFIADREGEKTTLERRNGYWQYNGKWRANRFVMESLLDAIGRIQMKYKPPVASLDLMIKDLATQGIKVELYDKRNNLLKAYYVGGGTADERGTHIMLEGANQPYVGHLSGWEGNLRFRFNKKGLEWRDKTVFSYEVEDIKAVSVEYPLQKNKSFKLEKKGKEYNIEPFYDITPKTNHAYKIGSAEVYLEGFENLGAEAFENENEIRDSISQLEPFSIVTLTDVKGNTKEMRLHPIYPKDAVDLETGKVIPAGGVERYFANLSNGDFMLIQHRVFGKVLWGYEFFYN